MYYHIHCHIHSFITTQMPFGWKYKFGRTTSKKMRYYCF